MIQVEYMKANGSRIRDKAMALKFIAMEMNIEVNSLRINPQEKDFTHGKMEIIMKVSGLTGKDTEKDIGETSIMKLMMEIGLMEKLQDMA